MLKSDCEITWLEEVNIINKFKIIIIAVTLIAIISIININIFMIIIILITVISIILSSQAGFRADGAGGSGLPAEGTAPSAGR